MEREEFTFEGQRQDERVMAIVKNHPFVLFWPGLKTVLLLAAAFAIIMFWQTELAGPFAFVVAIIGIGIFTRTFYLFSHSYFLISDQRVINIEQGGFWKKKITETEIEKIQDIASSTEGLFRTMLKFGDVVIHAAGGAAGSEIVVKNVANPYLVQQMVTKK